MHTKSENAEMVDLSIIDTTSTPLGTSTRYIELTNTALPFAVLMFHDRGSYGILRAPRSLAVGARMGKRTATLSHLIRRPRSTVHGQVGYKRSRGVYPNMQFVLTNGFSANNPAWIEVKWSTAKSRVRLVIEENVDIRRKEGLVQ